MAQSLFERCSAQIKQKINKHLTHMPRVSGASSVGYEARARKQRRTLGQRVNERKALKLGRKPPFTYRPQR